MNHTQIHYNSCRPLRVCCWTSTPVRLSAQCPKVQWYLACIHIASNTSSHPPIASHLQLRLATRMHTAWPPVWHVWRERKEEGGKIACVWKRSWQEQERKRGREVWVPVSEYLQSCHTLHVNTLHTHVHTHPQLSLPLHDNDALHRVAEEQTNKWQQDKWLTTTPSLSSLDWYNEHVVSIIPLLSSPRSRCKASRRWREQSQCTAL